MPRVYSTYEAKAKLGEILRKVREGQRIVITHRGEPVAEVRRIAEEEKPLAERLDRLEAEGILGPAADPAGLPGPTEERPGALSRFLESRK